MYKDWYRKLNYIWVSFGIYVLVLIFFLLSFSNFIRAELNTHPNLIREGLLLPQVDRVDTLFNVDPLLSNSRDEVVVNIRQKVNALIFSSLFSENHDGSLSNDIVTEYEFADATNLTIKIRDNILWSDGVRLTAEDIEFTLNTLRSLGEETIYAGAANGNDIQITVLSPTELRIQLQNVNGPRPNASYLYELIFPIIPKHVLSSYTKPDFNILVLTNFGKNPVTSGKFLYESNRINELTLRINESYYGELPKLNGYIFRFYQNNLEILDAYRLRNIDLFVRVDNLKDSLHSDLLSLNLNYSQSITRNRRIALYFNLNSKSETASIFNNFVSPRRAFLQAISRQEIFQEMDIALREIYGPIDPLSWAFSEDVLNRNSYNSSELDRVLKLLDYQKNGVFYEKDGKRLNIKISYLRSEFNQQLTVSIRNQLEKLGIEVRLESLEEQRITETVRQNSFTSVVNNREFDILLTYVDKNLDPDVFSEWHSSRVNPPFANFSGFSSRVADRALTDGRVLSKQEDRKTQYQRFQRAFYDESTPAMFLFNPSIAIYYRKDIKLEIASNLNTPKSVYDKISNWEVNVN